METKQRHPGAVLENGATLEGGARGGAELCTVKQLQGWSRFGSTFFLSDMYQGGLLFSILTIVFSPLPDLIYIKPSGVFDFSTPLIFRADHHSLYIDKSMCFDRDFCVD